MKILKKLLVFTLTLGLLGWGVSSLPTSATYGQNLPPGQRASGFLYDGTDVTLASGQLLLPLGAEGAPSLSFTGDTNTGIFSVADTIQFTVGGNEELRISGTGIKVDPGAAANPIIAFIADGDTGLYRIGVNNIGMSTGGALVMDWAATNAAGAGADLTTISFETGIMDGSDTVRGLFIDITSADHTGGANSNTLIGLDIDTIVADADTREIGLRILSGFDWDIHLDDTTPVVTFGSTGLLTFQDEGGLTAFKLRATAAGVSRNSIELSNALNAMDGSDTTRLLFLDAANANHTGTSNALFGIEIDAITGDAQAAETGIKVESGWDLGAIFNAPISKTAYRQDFDQLCDKREQADYTVELVTDGTVNLAACQGDINLFNYRLEGDQASPFIVSGGSLDIDNDGAENEGVEIVIADSTTTTQGWSVVGTSPAMFLRANITITSVSGTDNMYVGWRLQEAFQDNLVVASYNTYGTYLINSTGGNIVIQTDVNSTATGTDEDDQVADWGDAETHTLEVRLATDGVFTFYIDDLPSSISNANDAAEAGDIMIPMIGLLNAADADTEMKVNWIEIGEVI